MKGTLTKTEQGFKVFYTVDYTWDTSLPLHPKDAEVQRMLGWGGKEVEFEIVKEYIDSHTNQVQKYAKLVDKLGNEDVPKLGYDVEKLYTYDEIMDAMRMSSYSKFSEKDYLDDIVQENKLFKLLIDFMVFPHHREESRGSIAKRFIQSLKQPKK